MIILKVLIIILALLLLVLCLPVGADVGYCDGDLRAWLRIGGRLLQLYPPKPKAKKQPKPEREDKPKTEQPKKKRALPDVSRDEVMDAVSLAVKSVKKLRFHLHKLKLHFISAFSDPYQTAMVFGYANGAVSALGLEHLQQADIQIGADFEGESLHLDGYLSVTVRIYYICKLVCCFIAGALPILWRRNKRLKSEQRSKAAQGKEA